MRRRPQAAAPNGAPKSGARGIAAHLAGWLPGAPSSAASKGRGRAEAPPPEPIVYYDFPEIVVDLRAGPCRVSYIKILPVAELASEAQKTGLKEVEPRVLHALQSFLRGRTRTELMGEDGTETLRSAFLGILGTEMKPGGRKTCRCKESR